MQVNNCKRMPPAPAPGGIQPVTRAAITAAHAARIEAAGKGVSVTTEAQQLAREAAAKAAKAAERKAARDGKGAKVAPTKPERALNPLKAGPEPLPYVAGKPLWGQERLAAPPEWENKDTTKAAAITAVRGALTSARLAGAFAALQESPDPEAGKGTVGLVYRFRSASDADESESSARRARFNGQEQLTICESSASALRTLAELLSSARVDSVRVDRGVILTLLGPNGLVGRKWYAAPEKAHQGGKKAILDGKADRFRVSDAVTRVQFAADQLVPKRDEYKRVKRPVTQPQNYNKDVRWQKCVGDRNVQHNSAPAGYGRGWTVG